MIPSHLDSDCIKTAPSSWSIGFNNQGRSHQGTRVVPDPSLLHLRCEPLFASGISVEDVSWPTSAQLPGRLAPAEGCYRASASLSGFVGQGSSGKTYQAKLVGQGLSGKAGREGHR
ncbi:hypothetical protein ACFX2J_044274 [Malus domestica]